ncbi:hypothetical protein B566_EDAN007861 [Ephemera danica]|nr:hypothetical protein B566_EDAN007861 [Ephemera danica]
MSAVSRSAYPSTPSSNVSPRLSPMQEFFQGKNVFITGGSGFMGKILLEKLLRACPNLGSVFLLLRSKKGVSPTERVQELLQSNVFERVRRECGAAALNHVTAVEGDIDSPGLGLSAEDRANLCSNVHVVFHVAATVRFDERLKTALRTNLGGTRSVLQLAPYSNAPRIDIDEKVYPPPVDPGNLISSMDWLSEEQFDILAPTLISAWPNSYAFSKMLAENLVTQQCSDLPVAIFRPAIVTSTHMEPMPGWVDNMNGPAGITVGAQVGVIRCFRCDSKLVVDLVPEPKVYNFVSSSQKPLRWFEYVRYCEEHGLRHPSHQAIWYYMLLMTPHRRLFQLLALFLHELPARALDLASAALGRPQKMMKMYAKIDKFNDLMSYFTTRQWNFTDRNVRTLYQALSPEDRALFPFDLSTISWAPYIHNYMAGIRLHLLHEKPDNLKAARSKFFMLYLLHRGVQLGLVYGILRLTMGIASFLRRTRNPENIISH